MATAKEVAEWMVGELDREELLYQENVVYEIAERFGEEFTYENANGNFAIGKDVLAAFRAMTADTVVWVRGERYWRRRERGDERGRQQES